MAMTANPQKKDGEAGGEFPTKATETSAVLVPDIENIVHTIEQYTKDAPSPSPSIVDIVEFPEALPTVRRDRRAREPRAPGAYAVVSVNYHRGSSIAPNTDGSRERTEGTTQEINLAGSAETLGGSQSSVFSQDSNPSAIASAETSLAREDNPGLVEAQALSESQLQTAQPYQKQATRATNLTLLARLICFLVVVLIIDVVALAVQGSFSSSDELPPMIIEGSCNSSWSDALPRTTWNKILQQASNTPQYLAHHWVEEDPLLCTYTDEQVLQRFALACLYFSTRVRGEPWEEEGGGSTVIDLTDTALYTRPDVNSFRAAPVPGDIPAKKPQRPKVVNISSNHWLSYQGSHCDWFSLGAVNDLALCHPNDSRAIQHLDLEGNGLVGTLPSELQWLSSSLEGLFLSHNDLQGSIPSQIGSLQKIKWLDLSLNSELSGTVPSQLGLLSNSLLALEALSDQLSGTLPTELLQLSKLEQLRLGRNQLSGTLSNQIGHQMTALQILALPMNHMTGTLPSSLGLLSDLMFLDLAENQLTGTIVGSELSGLKNLTRIFLARNDLSGSLPSELGLLPYMAKLSVHNNPNLKGKFPSELRHWNATLQVLLLQKTSITGTIPSELCGIQKLMFDCSHMLCGCDCPCNSTNLV